MIASYVQDTDTLANPVGYLTSAESPYQPQAGDIVLYDDFNRFHHFLFKLASTAGPLHTGMIIARPDGTPGLFELTGPKVITAKVAILDVEPRFKSYPGDVMVRQLREPLTEDQSQALTRFAQAQVGKGFALPRVLLQGSLFSQRCELRKRWFGKTSLNRYRWFCSELVVAGAIVANLLDAKSCCANSACPRDLAYDETIDLSEVYHPPVHWTAAAPIRQLPVRRSR